MLERLRSYLKSPDLGDDPFVRLDSLDFADDGTKLKISVLDYDGRETWSRWRVAVGGLRDYRVTEPYGDLFLEERDHVLARQYTEPFQRLYFRGTPPSALETIERLLIAHRSIAGEWIPFERFLNFELPHREAAPGRIRTAGRWPAVPDHRLLATLIIGDSYFVAVDFSETLLDKCGGT